MSHSINKLSRRSFFPTIGTILAIQSLGLKSLMGQEIKNLAAAEKEFTQRGGNIRKSSGSYTVTVPFKCKTTFTDEDLAILEWFKDADTVVLSDVKIDGSCLKHLSKYVALQTLIIQVMKINGENLVALKDAANLRTLNLLRGSVVGPGLVHCKGLPNLESIGCIGCELDPGDWDALGSFPKLRSLSAEGCPSLNDDACKGIGKCQGLEQLELTKTAITDAGIKNLSVLRKLKTIELTGVAVGDTAVEWLLTCPELEVAILLGSNISPDGITRMTSSPKLRNMSINADQFSPVVANSLLKSPSLSVFNIYETETTKVDSKFKSQVRKGFINGSRGIGIVNIMPFKKPTK